MLSPEQVDPGQGFILVDPDPLMDRLAALEAQTERQEVVLWVLAVVLSLLALAHAILWVRQRAVVYDVAQALDDHVQRHTKQLRASLESLDHDAARVAETIGRSLGTLDVEVQRLQSAVLHARKGLGSEH